MGQIAPFNSPRLSASARTFSFGSEFVGNANSRMSSEAGGNNPGRQFAQRTKILMDCSTDELKKERVASCELRVNSNALFSLATRNPQLPRSSQRSPRSQAKRAVNPRFSVIRPNRGRFRFSDAWPREQLAAHRNFARKRAPTLTMTTFSLSRTASLSAPRRIVL